MNKPKIMIIDGHAMAYRAYYAMMNQNLTNDDGMPTFAIFAFYRMIAKLLKDFNPKYFLLTFDPPKKNFRHEMYKEYKANRKKTPDDLKIQIEEIIDIAKKLGFHVFIPKNEEADDAIASFVHKFVHPENKKKDFEADVLIVSGDKDLYNILYPDVTMLRAIKGVSEFKDITEKEVLEMLGVTTKQIPHFMALTGDTSDNIPGVKGVGEKTAAKLIQEYNTIDGIYENIDKIKPAGVQKKLIDKKEEALLSKKLVTLKKDIPIEFTLEDLLWKNNTDLSKNIKIFEEKGLSTIYTEWKKIINKFSNASTSSNIEGSQNISEEEIQINQNYSIIKTKEEWLKIEKELKKSKIIAFDTETNSIDAISADLVGVSFAWKQTTSSKSKDKSSQTIYTSAYVPVVFDNINDPNFDYNEILSGKIVIEWIKPILENEKIIKIGQNIKYDSHVMTNHSVNIQNFSEDTMLMSFLIDPNNRGHGLDDLAEKYLLHTTIKYKDLVGTGKKQKALLSIPINELAKYAAEDAEVTLRLFDILTEELKKDKRKKNSENIYKEIDIPLAKVLQEIEHNGFTIDKKYLQSLEEKYSTKLKSIIVKIYTLAEEEFNINSTKEMGRILFEKLNLTSTKKTPKGGMSTDAKALEQMKFQHPIVSEIIDYRMLNKLLTTYVKTLPEHINKTTGRIHTSFSQVTAATGRLASVNPNLQNIPIKGEDGRAIRKAFVPTKDHELLILDYSQIELRILAHYSEDKNLIQAYKEDQDIHDQATYLLFRKYFDIENNKWLDEALEDIDVSEIDMKVLEAMKATKEFSDKRSMAKIMNFSISYGVTDWGLSQNLNIPKKEAQALIDAYFISFPGIKQFMNDEIEKVKENGYSENLFGRKRMIFGLTQKNRFQREQAERLAINTPIQSTAADIIKVAMINIQNLLEEKKLKTKMLLQIHDELIFEVPPEEKEEVFLMVKNKMENVIKLKVPLTVNGGFGMNWEEAK